MALCAKRLSSPCEMISPLATSNEAPCLIEVSSREETAIRCNSRDIFHQDMPVPVSVQVPVVAVRLHPRIEKPPNSNINRRHAKRIRVKNIGKRRRRMLECHGGIKIDIHAKRSLTVDDSRISSIPISSSTVPTQSFVKSNLPNFWECPNCKNIPLSLRAKHSVFFCGGDDPPTNVKYPTVRAHFQLCEKRCLELNGKEFQKPDGTFYHSDSTLSNDHIQEGGIFADEPNNSRKSRRISNQEKKYYGDFTTWSDGRNRKRKRNSSTSTATAAATSSDKITPQVKPKRRKKNIAKQTPATAQQLHLPQLAIVSIPSTDNGLAQPSKDKHLTATIDILIMSQVERCHYIPSDDATAYLRQKPLPKNFPGFACVHCRAKPNEGKKKQQQQQRQPPKSWFFNSAIQVATGLPKIEQHLMRSCHACPKNIKDDIAMAKAQEEEERRRLRLKSSDKITRRQYASTLFDRLGAKGLLD